MTYAQGLVVAAQDLLARMSSTYKTRNGREMGIQGDDGEKCYIVHSDQIAALEGALARLAAAPQPEAGVGDFRCHNCKRVVAAIVAPERCPVCKCSAFSALPPSKPSHSPDPDIAAMREALELAIAGLGHINATCHDRAESPVRRPGNIARDTLAQVHIRLGSVIYDALADAAYNAQTTLATPPRADGEKSGLVEAARDAVGMLCHYIEFVRGVPAGDIEQHPYLPAIEQVTDTLSAALRRAADCEEPFKGLHPTHQWEPYLHVGDGYKAIGYRRADGSGYVLPAVEGFLGTAKYTGVWWVTFAHPMLCGGPGWHHHAFGSYSSKEAAAYAFDEVYALEYHAGNVDRCPELKTQTPTLTGAGDRGRHE